MALIKQALEDTNLYTLEKKIEDILSGNKKKYHIDEVPDKELLNCYIWGVPSGNKNTDFVKSMEDGDIVFFGLKNEIIYLGEVYKNYNCLDLKKDDRKKISMDFWGTEKYMELYFLKNVIRIECSMSRFNAFIGYNETAKFRGISRVANASIKNLEDSKDVLFKLWVRGVLKSNGK